MQLALFDTRPYTEFDFPDYEKIYSVFAYDKIKAHKFYKQKKQEAIKNKDPDIYLSINPYDTIEQFIFYNTDGTKKHLGDEQNIYRTKTMQSVYEQIGKILLKGRFFNYYKDQEFDFDGIRVTYTYYDNKPYEYKTVRDGWRVFKSNETSYMNGELIDTWQMSLNQRLKIHIALLRALRQGKTAKEAVEEVRERFKG